MNASRFALSGTVADTDETVPSDPSHPALVVLLEVGLDREIVRIVVPTTAWTGDNALLQAGRPVSVKGELRGRPFVHVATTLRLAKRLN
jgi:hypothetical protein